MLYKKIDKKNFPTLSLNTTSRQDCVNQSDEVNAPFPILSRFLHITHRQMELISQNIRPKIHKTVMDAGYVK